MGSLLRNNRWSLENAGAKIPGQIERHSLVQERQIVERGMHPPLFFFPDEREGEGGG